MVIHPAPGTSLSELGVPETPPLAEAQLLLFGADGSEEEYALWTSAQEDRWSGPPVLRVVEYDADSFVFGGTGVTQFLVAETVVCLLGGSLWVEAPEIDPDPILDLLDVPGELRALDREDESLATRLHYWADPALEDVAGAGGDPGRRRCQAKAPASRTRPRPTSDVTR